MTADLTAQDHRGSPRDSLARNDGLEDLLQPIVTDLIALALYAKNAHWNVSGPGFRSAHLALDELVATALLVADLVAERLKALEFAVDGSPQAVATRADTAVPTFCPVGSSVSDTLTWVASLIDDVTTSIRQAAGRVGQTDQPTVDLLNTITLDLEKQKWLLRSEL